LDLEQNKGKNVGNPRSIFGNGPSQNPLLDPSLETEIEGLDISSLIGHMVRIFFLKKKKYF